jgi:hypothetical protein
MQEQYTGTITRYEYVLQEDGQRSANTKHYQARYNVELTQEDGKKVWFYTSSLGYSISSAGNCVLSFFDSTKWDWGTPQKEARQGENAWGKTSILEATCKPNFDVGQTMTVKGNVKKVYGQKGVSLNYVKLVV